MSKKTKRSTRSSSARPMETLTVAAVNQSTQSATGSARSEKGFNPDYSDVIKDLKRIGTLAGTFFVIMVILSFFLK